ncbi:MAG TPA: Mov34/MPN/PAD-1 family protein [Methanothermobacter sp.]|nr:Mov34/MPN/PAD-1 family protein [Methanothermobacter sp.]HPQ04665.1 Mov34/MPN/PAD-1 family protein [Methanothermobacter sp.]HPU36747.1 Mov34/MPN/PAD-1 family protein [Methanothermobacter sp.]
MKQIKRIQVDSQVIDEIIETARNVHPREFAALLEGKVVDESLNVKGLIFLPGETSNEGAVMQTLMLPPFASTIGSVHSHPTPNNNPSREDLHFFSKNGLFHMIIAYPYREDTIASYDRYGNKITFEILKGL